MRHDVLTTHRTLYRPPSAGFVEVDIPPMRYLGIDGHGDPNTVPAYAEAVEAVYTSAYAVRAALKARTGDDFTVRPLEGLWTSADPATFVARDKSTWDWTMMIPLPDVVEERDITQGLAAAAAKKRRLPRARLVELTEGRCLQVLHVGPYDDEGPTLAHLHDRVMPERGLTWNGPHHEVYLGDPRRTAPEKLRTILRQPVRDRA